MPEAFLGNVRPHLNFVKCHFTKFVAKIAHVLMFYSIVSVILESPLADFNPIKLPFNSRQRNLINTRGNKISA